MGSHRQSVTAVDLQQYLGPDEEPVATAGARLRAVGAIDGTLACTGERVVFVSDGGVTDIAVGDVVALEYRDAGFPLWSAVLGVVLAVLGAFLLLVALSGAGQPVTTVLGGGLLVIGVATLAVGARGRAATLELHTPAGSFEFSGIGDDLSAFPSVIRGAAG